MTRGNQRDLAREKNEKKKAEANKGQRSDNLSHQARMEKDAAAMRAKQEAALAKKAGA